MKRIYNDWEPVVRSLIRLLSKNGYLTVAASNGEETIESTKTKELAEWVCQCDEGGLRVENSKNKSEEYHLFIVLGNSPSEIICDYSYPLLQNTFNFDKVTEEFAAMWNKRGDICPKIEK